MGKPILPLKTGFKKYLKSIVDPAWWFIRRPYFPWLVFSLGLFLPTLDPFNNMQGETPIIVWYVSLLLLATAFTIFSLYDYDEAFLSDTQHDGAAIPTILLGISGTVGLLISLITLTISFANAGYLYWLGLLLGSFLVLVFLGIDVYREKRD